MKSGERRHSGETPRKVVHQAFHPGSLLNNRWTILQVIGRGAFSEILAAKDNHPPASLKNKPFVAIKIQTVCRERSVLKTEANVLRDLSGHSYFPTLFAFHESNHSDDPEYIVMEYLCGEDMATIRNRARSKSSTGLVPLCIASYLARDMLRGLREMHARGYVHRDVKPSNFVRRDDKTTQFCVIDFGLTKCYRETNGQLRPEKEFADFRGTTIYASSFVHEGFDQCPRDDLISVLHVFFDMIIGKLPWNDAARSKCKPVAAALKLNMYRNPNEFIAWLCEEISAKSTVGYEVNFSSVTRTTSLGVINYLSSLKYSDVPDYDWLDTQFFLMVPELQRQDVGDINFSFDGFNWHETSSRSASFMASAMNKLNATVQYESIDAVSNSGMKNRRPSISRQMYDNSGFHLGASSNEDNIDQNNNTIYSSSGGGLVDSGWALETTESRSAVPLNATIVTSADSNVIKMNNYASFLEKLLRESAVIVPNTKIETRKEYFKLALRWANVMKLVYQLPLSALSLSILETSLSIVRRHNHFYGAYIEDDMPDRWEEFCQWQEMIGKTYSVYSQLSKSHPINDSMISRKRLASEMNLTSAPDTDEKIPKVDVPTPL